MKGKRSKHVIEFRLTDDKSLRDDGYRYYDEMGLSMSIVKSEVFPIFASKGLPMHMYCADTEADVKLCIEKGADLITANDPVPLMGVLKEQE